MMPITGNRLEEAEAVEADLSLLETMAEAAKVDFVSFLYYMNPQREGAPYYLENRYVIGLLQVYFGNLIQDIVDGRVSRNNTVSVPPQHGKSTTLTVFACAWLMGYKPGISIAITGFSHSLVIKFSMQIKRLVRSPLYQAIFPGVLPMEDHDRQDDWMTTNMSSIIAKSCGKKLTGRRVDWLVVDDAFSGRAEAESPVKRESIKVWYFADCRSRLAPGAVQLMIGTRFHPQDLIGHLTSEEYEEEQRLTGHPENVFHKHRLDAICGYPDNDPLGREEGEALFPEMRPGAFLRAQQAGIPAYEWESQFMNNPTVSSMGATDYSRLVFIEQREVPEGIEHTRGWDLACTEKQTSDWSVGAKVAMDHAEGIFYIVNLWREKLMWTKTKPEMIRVTMEDFSDKRYPFSRLGIEGVAGFLATVQDIRLTLQNMPGGSAIAVITKNPPKGGKLLRAQPWLNMVQAGKVRVVKAGWNKVFKSEFELFPQGCFVAGTMIATRRGEVAIEKVRIGDECLTRMGWKRVKWSGQTGVRGVISRFGLTATPEHRVYTNSGWRSLQDVREYDKLVTFAAATRIGTSAGIPPSQPAKERPFAHAANPPSYILGWREASCRNIAPLHVSGNHPCGDSGLLVPVFDLTVEDAHEFFANGVLVHNSHDDIIDAISVGYEVVATSRLFLA